MSHDYPLRESYESLKQKIKEYENKYYYDLDSYIEELRSMKPRNKFENQYENKIFPSNSSGKFLVTEYFNYDKILIKFLNTGFRMFARANNINRGEVKDPYSISILGIGYIGIGPYKIDGSPMDRVIYSRWRGIIERCYILKEGNKLMHPEWHNFQYFAAWFYSEFYIIPGCNIYDMCVDKDILFARNEEYSPYKCLIIPNFINNKIQLKDYDRMQIQRLESGEMKEHEINAMYSHKQYREMIVRKLADENRNILPPHVYLALKNYKMF